MLDTTVARSLMVVSDGSGSVEQPASQVRDVKPQAQDQDDKSKTVSLMVVPDGSGSVEQPASHVRDVEPKTQHQDDKSKTVSRKKVPLKPWTPLYNKFLTELEEVVDNHHDGDSFMKYMGDCCFKGKLLFMDRYREPYDAPKPLSVKKEEFFQVVLTQTRTHLT